MTPEQLRRYKHMRFEHYKRTIMDQLHRDFEAVLAAVEPARVVRALATSIRLRAWPGLPLLLPLSRIEDLDDIIGEPWADPVDYWRYSILAGVHIRERMDELRDRHGVCVDVFKVPHKSISTPTGACIAATWD